MSERERERERGRTNQVRKKREREREKERERDQESPSGKGIAYRRRDDFGPADHGCVGFGYAHNDTAEFHVMSP